MLASIIPIALLGLATLANAAPTTKEVKSTYVGCYQDQKPRTLRGGANLAGTYNTVAVCTRFCANKGYRYAGVENKSGIECFCDNEISNNTKVLPESKCNVPCPGDNGASICGGNWAIGIYEVALIDSSSSSAVVSSTAISSSTVASSTSLAVPVPTSSSPSTLPSGWSTIPGSECLAEVANRALDGAILSSPNMTIATCLNRCDSLGFSWAGLEYSSECHCGNALAHGSSLDSTSTGCNMACSGDATEHCGGSNALQIYYKDQTDSVNGYTSTTSINGYASSACVQEVAGRALSAASFTNTTGMTVEMCTSFCSDKGFSLAGIEYGSECYCDSQLRNGASLTPVSYECKMSCPGDAAQVCGGPNAISLWSTSDQATVAII